MIIKRVKIKNFLRLKDEDVSFEGKDIIGILGSYINDAKASNYVGKTTLLEAIRYCLTGNTRASKEVNLITYHEEEMLVEVTLEHDGREYVVTRGRDRKNIGKLNIDWIEKATDAQKEINAILGVMPNEFDHIFYFEQQDFHTFLKLSPTEKKQLLMNWLKNDHWKLKEERAKEDLKTLQKQLSVLDFEVSSIQKSNGNIEMLQDQYNQQKIRAERIKLEIEKNKEELEVLNENNKSISENELRQLKSEKTSIEEKVSKLNDYKQKLITLKSEIEELKKSTEEFIDEYGEDFDKLLKEHDDIIFSNQSLIAKFKNEITQAQNQLIKMNEHKAGICPILKEACDRIVFSEKDKEALRTEITTKNQLIVNCEEVINESRRERDKIKKVSKDKSTIEFKKSEFKTFKERYDNTLALNEKLEQLNNKIQQASEGSKNRESIRILQLSTSELSEELSHAHVSMGSFKNMIEDYHSKQEKLTALTEEMLMLNDEIKRVKFVVYMFGSKGIPSLEIENSFSEIEDNTNGILSLANPELRISFSPTRELSAWEDSCLSCGFVYPKGYRKGECEDCGMERLKKTKDELRIMVLDKGNEIEFEMCSGGMKTIVSLALRIAFSIYLRKQAMTPLDVLFLDEIDSAMDYKHKDILKDLITNLLKNKLNFKQIFWISHDKKISDSVPHVLHVRGHKDYSELEWA